MNIILLSGGSGTRLWPLSNEVRSKQFLKLFRNSNGIKESMAQRMYRMIREQDKEATITIATSRSQVPLIRSQLGDNVGISIEPHRRDTFPAIVLACAYLKRNGVREDEPVVVCPVDPYVQAEYFACLEKLSDAAHTGESNLVLMGIEPTTPSEKFGYIIPTNKAEIASVDKFTEKPDIATAEKYIEQGALWNGGIFAFKLGYVLDIAKNEYGFCDYETLYSNYEMLHKTSFDYAVVEKENSIQVIRFHGQWKDLGTWNSLCEEISENVTGDAVTSECEDTHVINELGIPVIALGLKNTVVAATPDGILVSDKLASSSLKEHVEMKRPMYERRLWGEYRVLDQRCNETEENSLVKELSIESGKQISYQLHHHRTEIWNIVEGVGTIIVDGITRQVVRGDSVTIPPETKHAIRASSDLKIIEIQLGDKLVEEDIERIPYEW